MGANTGFSEMTNLVVKIEKEDNSKKEKINKLFRDTFVKLKLCLDQGGENQYHSFDDTDPVQKIRDFAINKLPKYHQLYLDNKNLFDNDDFIEILLNDLHILHDRVDLLDTKSVTNIELSQLLNPIQNFMESFRAVEVAIIAIDKTNRIIDTELNPKIEEVKEKIKDFESLQLALEQRETSSIYLELYNKYYKEYELNNYYFFGTLLGGAFFTILTMFSLDRIIIPAKTEVSYWTIFITTKVLIVTITITLCTLFLRRASHAKKLKEQAYQTHVEINAFPIHVRSLKDEDKHELIKELALKYFGKELDQTQNDKIGDLMKDQLTAGTELIKASAELVKAKGESKLIP